MYHSLSDGEWPDSYEPKYSVTVSRFTDHLRFLKDSGCVVSSCADLAGRLDRKEELPAGYCLMTIDDGHKSSMEMAEMLARFGFSGTFFMTMDYCIHQNDFLKPDEIRALCADGFDVGTHGRTHMSLADMEQKHMLTELKDSKEWLEDITGKPAAAMSLPGGRGGPAVREAVFNAGYKMLCTSREMMNRPAPLPVELARFAVLKGYGQARIKSMLEGRLSWILYRRLRSAILYLPKKLMRTFDRTR